MVRRDALTNRFIAQTDFSSQCRCARVQEIFLVIDTAIECSQWKSDAANALAGLTKKCGVCRDDQAPRTSLVSLLVLGIITLWTEVSHSTIVEIRPKP
jgi:hypothetical protein